MKKILKYLSLFLFSLVMVYMVSQTAQAASHENFSLFDYEQRGGQIYVAGDYEYIIVDGEAFITKANESLNPDSTSLSGHVYVPSQLDGYPVTFLYGMSFAYCNEITEVTIPDSVITIGFNCFRECKKLTTVNLGANVKTFIGQAFYECRAFTTLNWGPNVKTIGRRNFENCDALVSITIPDTVTTIGEYAFAYCDNLTSVTLSENLTTLEQAVLHKCPKLESVVIPDSVQAVGKMCFDESTGLKSAVIGKGVKSINLEAFQNCTSLTTVVMNEAVEFIDERAFKGCESLESIVIPDTTTAIGNFAFDNCKSLTTAKIGNSVKTIGDCAFRDCSALETIIIPDSVTELSNHAFQHCSSATVAKIGCNVKKIGIRAFDGCASLTEIVIPDSVTVVEKEAFASCGSAKTLSVGKGVTEIGDQAFSRCTSLESATIHEGLTVIGKQAFNECTSLQRITVAEENPNYSSDDRGVLFDKNKETLIQAPGAISGAYTMPDTVTAIGEYAFSSCNQLTRVVFADGVKSLGAFGFIYCENLEYVDYGESLESVGSFSFGYCNKLTEVNLPASLKTIGPLMYRGCQGLVDIVIPDTVETIGAEAFANCSQLKSVKLGAGVKVIQKSAFEFVEHMTDITVFEDLEAVQDSAFYRCDDLTDVYYNGTSDQWYAITIGRYNDTFRYANLHCIEPHEHVFKNYVSDNNATCTEDGTETATCEECSLTDIRTVPGSALGHTGGIATCVDLAVCTRCGIAYGDKDSANHTATELKNVMAEDCTVDGYSGDLCCLGCGVVVTPGHVIPAAHQYTTTVVPPSYVTSGYSEHACTRCGHTYQDGHTNALGLPTPEISVKNDPVTGRPIIVWEAIADADKYEIFRSTTSGKGYASIGTTTEIFFQDDTAASGKTYYYKIRAVCEADDTLSSKQSAYKSAKSLYGKTAATVTYNGSGNPVIEWNKVSGAKKYDVYHATAIDGTYKKLASVSSTSYTHSKAAAGKVYFYKVCAYGSSASYAGAFSEVVSGAKKLGKPNITVTVNNDARTAKITWKKVTNAIGYELQYKVNDGAFTSLGLVAGTVYTHENLFVGNTYTYRLIALSDKAETCSDYSAEKDIAIVCAKPVLTTSNNEAGKPVLNWDAVEGAVAYEIQIATAAKGKYKQLAVVTAVEFTHVDAEAAKTNYYKVCAIDANGTAGAFSAYKSAICDCDAPVITEVTTNIGGYPTIKWGEVTGAKKYEVFCATSPDGAYKKVATVSSASYTYTQAKMDQNYYFKVRAYGSSTVSTGNFSDVVCAIRKLGCPKITLTTSQTNRKITIKWSKVKDAISYELQCSINDGAFTTIAVTNKLNFVHEGLAPGNKYTYRLRALGTKVETIGDYCEEKTATIKVGKPVLTISLGETGKPKLTWGAVEGAVKYEVYYSATKNGKYKLLETTDQLTFIHELAETGKNCYFQVCAVAVNGSTGDYSSVKYIKSK